MKKKWILGLVCVLTAALLFGVVCIMAAGIGALVAVGLGALYYVLMFMLGIGFVLGS